VPKGYWAYWKKCELVPLLYLEWKKEAWELDLEEQEWKVVLLLAEVKKPFECVALGTLRWEIPCLLMTTWEAQIEGS
jgi:hypothetical protein